MSTTCLCCLCHQIWCFRVFKLTCYIWFQADIYHTETSGWYVQPSLCHDQDIKSWGEEMLWNGLQRPNGQKMNRSAQWHALFVLSLILVLGHFSKNTSPLLQRLRKRNSQKSHNCRVALKSKSMPLSQAAPGTYCSTHNNPVFPDIFWPEHNYLNL